MKNQHHFSRIAHKYDDLRTTDLEPILFIKKKLQNLTKIEAADVGCGGGRYNIILFHYFGDNLRLTCIDDNKNMLDEVTKNLKKHNIKNFKGGNFIVTVPSGNYRCLQAPYERACIIADYFKQNMLKAKVILLDENNAITIKKEGFQSAFDELYIDYIDYRPNTKIENINLDEKIVETEFEEISFEDAAFYPHVRGAKILERAGIAKDAKNMLEGDINPLTYEVNGHKNI